MVGVAVVRLYLEEEHYVLMTGIQNENILLFDPYYWDKPYEQKDILMDDKHPKEYNRIVPFKYFNQENKEIIYVSRTGGRDVKQFLSSMKRQRPYRRKLSSTLSE